MTKISRLTKLLIMVVIMSMLVCGCDPKDSPATTESAIEITTGSTTIAATTTESTTVATTAATTKATAKATTEATTTATEAPTETSETSAESTFPASTLAPGEESSEDCFEWDDNKICGLTDKGREATEFVIPSRCTEIGYFAFGHSEATKVTIGPNVEVIGKSAFIYCESITEIVIPPSVKVIGESAFASCDNLRSITFSEGLEIIYTEAFDGIHSYDKEDNLMTITLPEGLTTVEKWAFDSQGIKEIYLPESLVDIPNKAFNLRRHESTIYVKEGSWADLHFDEYVAIDDDDGTSYSVKAYY